MNDEQKGNDVEMYKGLLRTVLAMLMNVTEMYDAVIELNSFNRVLLNKVSNSDCEIRFLTGFYSFASLQYFITYLITPNLSKLRYWVSNNSEERQHYKCGRKRSTTPEDELFLTLVKLKHGSQNGDLAERFQLSPLSVSRIFLTCVKFFESILSQMPIWMSRKRMRKTLPDSFKGLYDDVTIIIDCTETECEKTSDIEVQAATYSEYKSRNTVKALIGISPSGIPTSISDLMEGSVSDNEITMKSGLLEKQCGNGRQGMDKQGSNGKAWHKTSDTCFLDKQKAIRSLIACSVCCNCKSENTC